MHKLFVDLDGVLADFENGVRRVTGRLPHDQPTSAMWRQLARHPGFYEHLDWMADGRELWEYVRDLDPTILTGLPFGRWARPQKLTWCARELGPDVPVITCWSRKKAETARGLTPEGTVPVLIDDREWLGESWEAMNGVFIHHTTASSSIAALVTVLDGERRP